MGQILNRMKNIAKSEVSSRKERETFDLNDAENIFASADNDLEKEIEKAAQQAEARKKKEKQTSNDDDFSVIDIETN